MKQVRWILVIAIVIFFSFSFTRFDAFAVEKILFSSTSGAASGTNQRHIWMVNPDGTGLEQVTTGDVRDSTPTVSPDGTKLAFTRNLNIDCNSVFVRDLQTGQEWSVTGLTDFPNSNLSSFEPHWSPDGMKIAFSRSPAPSSCAGLIPGQTRVWVVDVDFSPAMPAFGTPTQLSPASGASRHAGTWDPDGSNIAFYRALSSAGPWEIWKITYPGGVESKIIDRGGGGIFPKTGNRIILPMGHMWLGTVLLRPPR